MSIQFLRWRKQALEVVDRYWWVRTTNLVAVILNANTRDSAADLDGAWIWAQEDLGFCSRISSPKLAVRLSVRTPPFVIAQPIGSWA